MKNQYVLRFFLKISFCFTLALSAYNTPESQRCAPRSKASVAPAKALTQASLFQFLPYVSLKKDDLLNDLDYFSSKGIDLECSLLFNRVKLTYKARWGYRGAGDEQLPFQGFKGTFTIPVTVAQGLTIDPLQADKAKELLASPALQSFVTVSPTDELQLKLFSLFLTVGKDEITPAVLCQELKKLLHRAARTPNFTGLEIHGIRLVGTPDNPGYCDILVALPPQMLQQASEWVAEVIKVITRLMGAVQGPDSLATLKKLIASLNYQENDFVLLTKACDDPNASTPLPYIRIDFGYRGLGNGATPFQGCTARIQLPSCIQGAADAFTTLSASDEGATISFKLPQVITLSLDPLIEYFIKTAMLLASSYNGSFPAHRTDQELEALLHRLLITPDVGDVSFEFGDLCLPLIGTEKNPGILRILSMKTHLIMHYDFTAELPAHLSSADAITFLASIIYKARTDYAATRAHIRAELEKTDDGKKALKALHTALEEHHQKGTTESADAFQQAIKTYRTLELAAGKKDFEKIGRFVVKHLGVLTNRLGGFKAFQEVIKSRTILKEFEENGIHVDFHEFWQELGK